MRRPEEGSALPLVLVMVLIGIAFTGVVAGATALHLDRMRLLTVADGAALAAAESFHAADVRIEDGAVRPVLTGAQVEAAAAGYLADGPVSGVDGVRLAGAAAVEDGRAAEVVVTGTWRPPLVGALLPVAVPIEARSVAAARFG